MEHKLPLYFHPLKFILGRISQDLKFNIEWRCRVNNSFIQEAFKQMPTILLELHLGAWYTNIVASALKMFTDY